jgi:amidase
LLDATSGPDIGDPYCAPPPKRPYVNEVGADPGRLKIAFTTKAWNGQAVDPQCVDAVAGAASLCQSLGHHVEEASPAIDEAARLKAVRIRRWDASSDKKTSSSLPGTPPNLCERSRRATTPAP